MVEDTLQQLASQLGTSVEYLWSVIVRLQRYEAIEYLAQVVILSGWTVFSLRPGGWARRWIEVESSDSYDLWSRYQAIAYAALAVTATVWVAAFFQVDALIGLFDPEAAAAQAILGAFRGGE